MTKKLNESTDSHIVRLLFLHAVHQKRNRRRKSKLCAAAEESSSPLLRLLSAGPVIARPPQGPNSSATVWSHWQMRAETRPNYCLGLLKWHAAISLSEPEAPPLTITPALSRQRRKVRTREWVGEEKGSALGGGPSRTPEEPKETSQK